MAASSARRLTTEDSTAAQLGTPIPLAANLDPVETVDICTRNLSVIRDFLLSCKEGLGKKQNCLLAIENLQRGLQNLLVNSAKVNATKEMKELFKNNEKTEKAQIATPSISYREATTRGVTNSVGARIVRPEVKSKKHKIIIKPTADCAGIKSSEDTKKVLMKNKASDYGIKVDRVVTLRDNSVLIESSCASILKIGESEAFQKTKLAATPVNKNWPRMQILDIPENETADNIKRDLQKQNLPTTVPKEFIGKMFKFGKKNGSTTSWIVELHPAARSHFVKIGRIFTEWRSHTIRDFLLVSRCYHCQRFGHIAKYCKSPKQCGFCASTEHEGKDCKSKTNKGAHKCANCLRSGAKDSNHHAASEVCPILKHRMQEQLDATMYEVDG